MGERNLDEQIVTMAELILSKRFDSVQDIYQMPDSVLPRVRRNGRIIRPLRFYRSDVESLFSNPGEAIARQDRSLKIENRQEPVKIARPSILFKRRRK